METNRKTEYPHHKNTCNVFIREECNCGETKKQDWEVGIEKILRGHGGFQVDNPLVISSVIFAVNQIISTQEEKIRKEERERPIREAYSVLPNKYKNL